MVGIGGGGWSLEVSTRNTIIPNESGVIREPPEPPQVWNHV